MSKLALTFAPERVRPEDRPVTLDSFGETLTDADLAQLLQRSPQWAYQERHAAKKGRREPDLPERLRGRGQARYHREAVAAWLRGRGGRRR